MLVHVFVQNGYMIDLRRLEALRAVDRCGTVTAAAEALYVSPSAVSQQLRSLARDLDVTLLESVGRRVRLTPAGHTLLRHADALAAQWEQAQADLHGHRDELTGRLELAGFPTAVAALIAPAAARLRAAHPRLAVHIAEIEPADAPDLLLSHAADLAVVEATSGAPPRTDRRFDQRPLLAGPMDLLVAADHPLAGRSAIELAEAAEQPWIVGEEGSSYRQLTAVACASAGFAPEIAHTAKEWIAVGALVSLGFGVAVVPRVAHIPPDQRVVRIPLYGEPIPSWRIMTCMRRGSHDQPAINRALRALSDVAATHRS